MTAPVSLSKDGADVGDVVPIRPWVPAVSEPTATEVAEPLTGEVLPPVTAIGRIVPAEDDAAREALALAAGRMVARSVFQVSRGHGVWARRAVDAATYGLVREQIRQARADGDREALAEWHDRLQAAKAGRRQRLLNLPATLRSAVVAVMALVALLAGLLLVLGIVVAVTTPAGVTWGSYWGALAMAGDILATIVAVAVQVVVYGAGPAWLVAAYRAGKAGGVMPGWALAPSARDEATSILTPVGLAESLAHLGIAPLNKAIKDGWTVGFDLQPVRVNGRGYQTVFSLPMGVTPDMIVDKRDVLARNLNRDPFEVWPAKAERAGYVDLWVADSGSTSKPAPEYPLLHAGTADVFAGVPLGVIQRGDALSTPLVEANVVYGGMMGQGKSNAARVVMLGAALDPLAELWVYVFAGNGDFDAYQPRLARYERGADDSVVHAALDGLRELYEEVGRREARLSELNAKKVTRGLAEKHPDLRPIVALFSECHELFGHKAKGEGEKQSLGEMAADVAVQTIRRARKTGITLMFDTQSSRADAIPPKIVELVKLNCCFAVKSWRSNDGFLGDGSFQAGIRATELRPGKDRGTSLLTGATAERFEILRWYFVAVDDDSGWDAATDVIARAMASVHPAVQVGGRSSALELAPVVDHLADIHTALRGEPRVRTQDVLSRLAQANPSHYGRWNPQTLTSALSEHGAEPGKSNGIMVVRLDDIQRAITERSERDGESGQGGEPDSGSSPYPPPWRNSLT